VDLIYLHDLKVDTVIGIWDWERRTTQRITIDLDIAVDIGRAAATDAIQDTLDYKSVAKRVTTFVGESRFQLVETLTEKIAELLLAEFPTPWVRVRVNKKGAIRGASDVGVVIERGRKTE
jgi:dihydroneopterin aldolase